MPRKSSEARAALLYHSGGKAPAPPAHLDRAGKSLWRTITHAYPVDYFRPGSEQLLEAFIEAVIMRRFYVKMWRDSPDPDHIRSITLLTNTLNQTAQKLRISNSARINRHSGMLDETDTMPVDGKNVLLFGSGRY
jgi:hypothetical protein